jgi:putative polymerase
LLLIAVAVALWEWLAVDSFLRYFNVSDYYVARGTVNPEQHFSQYIEGFFNSARFNTRTLLPVLGNHRVSGIFLEAPSVGNFAAIVFAWILLRPHSMSSFILKAAGVLVIIVWADARFGLYFCLIELLLVALNSVMCQTVLFIGPFVALACLWCAGIVGPDTVGDDMVGRFLYAGHILTSIHPAQVFGLMASDIYGGVRFAENQITDSPTPMCSFRSE